MSVGRGVIWVNLLFKMSPKNQEYKVNYIHFSFTDISILGQFFFFFILTMACKHSCLLNSEWSTRVATVPVPSES